MFSDRRRKKLVWRRFQTKTIVFMLFVAVFSAAVVGSVIYCLIWFRLSNIMSAVPAAISLADVFNQANRMLVFALPGVMVVVVVAALHFSHRIAGPLYRLDKSMRQIEAGEIPDPISFRKSDEFTQLADTFNRMVTKLRESLAYNEEKIEEMGTELNRFLGEASRGSVSEEKTVSFLNHLNDEMAELRKRSGDGSGQGSSNGLKEW